VIGFVITFGRSVWRVMRSPAQPAGLSLVVNDVSQLNPIVVSRIVKPTTVDEIASAVRTHELRGQMRDALASLREQERALADIQERIRADASGGC
jgi:hypothetical protein